MKRRAVYAGSFDPFTVGHSHIVEKALLVFDELIIAVGINIHKSGFMSVQERVEAISEQYSDIPAVKVTSYNGLTTDFCKESDAKFIVRGVRDIDDFMYERRNANVNATLAPDIETVLFFSAAEYGDISSSAVREILVHKGDISKFVPATILKYIKK